MNTLSIKRADNNFEIIDQTALPQAESYVLITNYQDMIKAIKTLQIRGAPAIGLAAMAGAYLACEQYRHEADFETKLSNALNEIENSRPTAVNLHRAIEKVKSALTGDSSQWLNKIDELVNGIMQYEFQACENMAENGLQLIPKEYTRFLTHCNTGSLATYGSGTALGVLKKIASKRDIEVYVDETRPLLQGSRLTMWELMKANIKCHLITDNMAARTIEQKKIQAIIVGADRIARNRDTANKIGTFNLAILAKYFNIPFYVVAPETTIDNKIESGKEMIIEERGAEEIVQIKDIKIAPENAIVYNPAFDITPSDLITAIITDKSVYRSPRQARRVAVPSDINGSGGRFT
jgi:methylthioribose-1-phosphate isomerase